MCGPVLGLEAAPDPDRRTGVVGPRGRGSREGAGQCGLQAGGDRQRRSAAQLARCRGQPDTGPEAVAGQWTAQPGRLPGAVAGVLVPGAVGDRQQRGHGQPPRLQPRKPCSIPWRQAYRAASVGPVGCRSAGALAPCGPWHAAPARGSRLKAVPAPSQSVPGPPPRSRAGTRSPPVGRKVMCSG